MGDLKHTPGPWAAFTDDSGARPHTNIVSFVPITDRIFSLPGHDKGEANVRLIAAAPDLLTSLKEVISWQSLDMLPPEIRGAWMRARAAVAKAETPPHQSERQDQ